MVSSQTRLNPFPGLRPFEAHENDVFFGREGQTDELLRRLRRHRFLAVVGTSGSGKSSLVRAGLLPALFSGFMTKAGSSWRVAIMRPGNDPIANLAQALNHPDVFGLDTEINQDLRTENPKPRSPLAPLKKGGILEAPFSRGLGDLFHASPTNTEDAPIQTIITETVLRRGALGLVEVVQQARRPSYENLLIVVDQFEELFRFKQNSPRKDSGDEAAAFVKLLLEATHTTLHSKTSPRPPGTPLRSSERGRGEVIPVNATQQQELPIYVVLTMRSDFLGDCAQFRDLPEAMNDSQYLIPRLTRDQLQAAITGPVGVGNAQITPRLVNRLINDVDDNPDQLPILQHALMRTWNDHKLGEPIDLHHYQAIGGMDKALSQHADEIYNQLPDERCQKIAEKLFKCLTEKGSDSRGIRRPTKLSEVCAVAEATEAAVIDIVEQFRAPGRSFLMPPVGVRLDENSVLDISHESLTRIWQKLKDWLEEEAQSARIYRRLAETSALYQEKQAGLWREPELTIALNWREENKPNQAWAGRYDPQFERAMQFLEESARTRDAEVAEKERRQQEELRRQQDKIASQKIAAVNEIAIAINRSLKLDEILRVVSKQAKWLLDFKHCSVCLRDTTNGSWRIVTLFGSSVEISFSDITYMDVVGISLKTGQARLIHENSTSGFLSQYQSQIIIPLECDNRVLGTINFATSAPKVYTQEDLRIGYLLAVQLSAAIRNAERFEELNRLYVQLEEEKHKTDKLLLNILPTDIASELKQTGTVKPVHYESASVLFTDFKNFTKLSEQLTPEELVDELDYCFSCFDQFIEAHNLEKLKTIGDSYMCAGGIPIPNKTHAIDTVLAAINIRTFMEWRKKEKALLNQPYWDICIGIHSGALLAGVIGHKKFAYDVWGDTVNIASTMESSGLTGSINISQATFELIKDFFTVESRGKVSDQKKGEIDMYIVKGIKDTLALDATGLLPNKEFNKLYFAILPDTDTSIEERLID
jgi:class 3 adenylate cyclase